MRIRRSVNRLGAAEKADYVRAVKALKEEKARAAPGPAGEQFQGSWYDWYVWVHEVAAPLYHQCPLFLPWHRLFIMSFEKSLSERLGKDFALPYWDWANDAAEPESAHLWAADFLGGDGAPDAGVALVGLDSRVPVRDGPFAGWATFGDPLRPTLERQFRMNLWQNQDQGLPKPEDVDWALAATVYDMPPWNSNSPDGFRNRLEGFPVAPRTEITLHNRVHMWIGGSMLPMTSPNDPVFFLHHCNVDRLWSRWQALHPDQGYQPLDHPQFGQAVDMWPFASQGWPVPAGLSCTRDVWDHVNPGTPPSGNYGYGYEAP